MRKFIVVLSVLGAVCLLIASIIRLVDNHSQPDISQQTTDSPKNISALNDTMMTIHDTISDKEISVEQEITRRGVDEYTLETIGWNHGSLLYLTSVGGTAAQIKKSIKAEHDAADSTIHGISKFGKLKIKKI